MMNGAGVYFVLDFVIKTIRTTYSSCVFLYLHGNTITCVLCTLYIAAGIFPQRVSTVYSIYYDERAAESLRYDVSTLHCPAPVTAGIECPSPNLNLRFFLFSSK